jgi:7,8-dihydro-6-hydroxymethylpterin-pyrophosphokinase
MGERRFVLAPLRDLAPDLVEATAVDQSEGHVTYLGPLD